MKRLIPLGLFITIAASAACAEGPDWSIAVTWGTEATTVTGAPSNLHGNLDFLLVVNGAPSFRLFSVDIVYSGYGSSLTPVGTAPMVLRKIALVRNSIQMIVASREGDVLFDRKLARRVTECAVR